MAEPVPDTELHLAMAGPAVAANRFIATTNGVWVRLSFLEQGITSQEAQFRSAVILTQTDLVALIDLLSAYVPQIEVASDGKQ